MAKHPQWEWGWLPGCAHSEPVAQGHAFWDAKSCASEVSEAAVNALRGGQWFRMPNKQYRWLNIYILCLQIGAADSSICILGLFPSVPY